MKNIKDLTKEEQKQALAAFRGAVKARNNQWNHESVLEDLLDGEINIDIAYWASAFEDGSGLTLDDLQEALEA